MPTGSAATKPGAPLEGRFPIPALSFLNSVFTGAIGAGLV
jgi:hypothetical protein